MIIMTCIIVPLAGIVIYLGMDAIICALDHTCGNNLFTGGVELIRKMHDAQEITFNLMDGQMTVEDAAIAQQVVSQISTPWIYMDEIFGITLPFLLGAVFFKKGKTAKTILALFAISTATSIIMTPFLTDWAKEIVSANEAGKLMDVFFNNGLFKNLVLLDTISDAAVNIAMLTGIWFRIKTLKH